MVFLPLFLSLSFIVVAQDTAEPFSYGATTIQEDGGPEKLPSDTEDVPIDSWVVVLLFVGFLYGIYKRGGQEKIEAKRLA